MNRLLITDIDYVFYNIPFLNFLKTEAGILYEESLGKKTISPLSPECVSRLNSLLSKFPDIQVIFASSWSVLESTKTYEGITMSHFVQAGFLPTKPCEFMSYENREQGIVTYLHNLEEPHDVVLLNKDPIKQGLFEDMNHRVFSYNIDPEQGFGHNTLVTLESFYGDV